MDGEMLHAAGCGQIGLNIRDARWSHASPVPSSFHLPTIDPQISETRGRASSHDGSLVDHSELQFVPMISPSILLSRFRVAVALAKPYPRLAAVAAGPWNGTCSEYFLARVDLALALSPLAKRRVTEA